MRLILLLLALLICFVVDAMISDFAINQCPNERGVCRIYIYIYIIIILYIFYGEFIFVCGVVLATTASDMCFFSCVSIILVVMCVFTNFLMNMV